MAANLGALSFRVLGLAAALHLAIGCATTSSVLREGLLLETRAVRRDPEHAPSARRLDDGRLEIQWTLETVRHSVWGGLLGVPRHVGMDRTRIEANPENLRPAQEVLQPLFAHRPHAWMDRVADPIPEDMLSRDPSGAIPVLGTWPQVEGGQLAVPSRESVVLEADFVWYVPGTDPEMTPSALIIPTGGRRRSPIYAYSVRILMLPAALAMDVYWNAGVTVATVLGRPIDL